MDKIYNALVKYQKYLIGLAIFLTLSAVSITVTNGQVKLALGTYPLYMILLVTLGLTMAILYIAIDKYKINTLSNSIIASSEDRKDIASLLPTLTNRQAQIYTLILSGKSNKEIMSELYIEQSTLKSHINQIYKKLKVNNRKELKAKSVKH